MYRKPTFPLGIVELNSYTDKKTGGLWEHRYDLKGNAQAQ